ncbi:hypothetical protein [Bifidobacterium xylocopae]|uniref:Uncharacterized protein n=1 Tax=Bifidobacterium xylocopae TaxID=2493119 RepID=A0A366KED2_9BIFI|nr:hypothetical protein [Bifidobacterium xylocopae]RBP99031.1 hypothetical protein CRD59_06065 [Bifidobacterium xylocopae]
MKALTNVLRLLTVVYAVLMAGSAVAAVHTEPLWCLLMTIVFAACLLGSLRWDWLLPVGLLGLIAAAIANGLSMYGRIHEHHLIIRILFSLILLALWLACRPSIRRR